MRIANFILLICEIILCIIIHKSDFIAFGYGETDLFIYFFLYLSVCIHLLLTIYWTIKKKKTKSLLITFGIISIFFVAKASIYRGEVWPWDGEIIVNKGKLQPLSGNKIKYTISFYLENGIDTTFHIEQPDPELQYISTLWVSDPECTGCNDCVIDSGIVKIPEILKPYISKELGENNILFLTGKSPYDIQNEAYVKYKISGQIIGVKEGRIVFYVSEWNRL